MATDDPPASPQGSPQTRHSTPPVAAEVSFPKDDAKLPNIASSSPAPVTLGNFMYGGWKQATKGVFEAPRPIIKVDRPVSQNSYDVYMLQVDVKEGGELMDSPPVQRTWFVSLGMGGVRHKTGLRNTMQNPVWNEKFIFIIPRANLEHKELTLELYDMKQSTDVPVASTGALWLGTIGRGVYPPPPSLADRGGGGGLMYPRLPRWPWGRAGGGGWK